ncbi:immune inhibitor A domain-containing protein [Candidatus Villigracilis affinis]|uniref:immune inhibitor A domain-containing protein n=1 Tax=Candidatus Villigracilis affinis TaxID=3140682 RepID=UPI001D26CF5B|nr:immune inhibitor A [Anaerolineales bacterium]
MTTPFNPENGGLGVFAHEYAHDLGLPDECDTAGGANSTRLPGRPCPVVPTFGDGTTDIGSNPRISMPGRSSNSAGSTLQ